MQNITWIPCAGGGFGFEFHTGTNKEKYFILEVTKGEQVSPTWNLDLWYGTEENGFYPDNSLHLGEYSDQGLAQHAARMIYTLLNHQDLESGDISEQEVYQHIGR